LRRLPDLKQTEYEVETGYVEASVAAEGSIVGKKLAGREDDGEGLEVE
jgi:hypothetical protein